MIERMSAADVAFLHRETRALPQHVGGLAVFDEPAAGFDYDRLVRLLEERISLAPRYRQKVRMVPGHLAHPVWVDDPAFDITYHVRRSALPRPGDEAALLEFCARIQSRMLDRARPLWEMYLVEGLSGGRLAIVTKTHEAMITEAGGIDIAEVILDAGPAPRRTVEAIWMPGPEPSAVDLVRDAVGELIRRPFGVLDTARGVDVTRGPPWPARGSLAGVGRTLATTGAALVRRPPTSPLAVTPGEQRRVAIARTRLDDYRAVRDALGGTVNDVVLAVVTGALRGWLLSRALPASPVRALVPVSTTDTGQVTPLLVDLPVAEPDPVLRLAQVRYAMSSHQSSGRAVEAERLVALSGFAPPTLHTLAARAAADLARRMFTLVVSNVPGPQHALYAAGARMTEMFPIQPLGAGQALTIALTSYDGGVYYGLNADRDAVPDLRTLAELVEESLAELVAVAGSGAAAVGRRPGPARRTDPAGPGVRVHLPGTAGTLRDLLADGELRGGAGELTGFAVTPALREWYVDDDAEELEYAAMAEAARASLRLLDGEPDAPRRRIVLAADVADAQVEIRDDLDRGVVRIATAVPLAAVASVHADDADAEATVRTAAAAVTAADLGDESAEDAVTDAEGFELAWYANQEIADLLEGMEQRG